MSTHLGILVDDIATRTRVQPTEYTIPRLTGAVTEAVSGPGDITAFLPENPAQAGFSLCILNPAKAWYSGAPGGSTD